MGNKVGVSERTYGKHCLLNRLLGKQVGAASQLVYKKQMRLPFVFIDLCAGDGQDTLESGFCSPGIIQKHSGFIKKHPALGGDNSSIVILIEKDRSTYDILKRSQYAEGATVIHGDARDQDTLSKISEILWGKVSPQSPIFVQNDPNNVHGWAITPDLFQAVRFPGLLLTYSTLGCNAGGLKMMVYEHRRQWQEKVGWLVKNTLVKHSRLDLCLVSLSNDGHQWAYMMTIPTVWRTATIDAIEKSFGYWKHGLEYAWMSDPAQLNAMATRLFLTGTEIESGMKVELL